MLYNQSKKRVKLILQGFVILGLLVVALAAAFQIDQVREFFSQASGEPANLVVDVSVSQGPVQRPWRNYAQGGEGHDWRIEPITSQVKALKPEYIRIDHIYDFYNIVGGSSGNLTFDFSKFDVILDDIEATGAKPYIALSYMPPAIATGDIVSTPQNYADWQLVVQKTIQHVSGTRGTTDVYYEVWNEPDLFGGWKYYGDKSYIQLYGASARGALAARKAGVKPFKIGGPVTTALYKNWFTSLIRYTEANNLPLDFISWHRYTLDVEQYKKDMTEAYTWLREFPATEAKGVELHITEWGHDSNNHGGYDTNFAAAYTVASAIEMSGVLDRAFLFEIQDGKNPEGKEFWGRWGLLTHQDFGSKPKPRYRALLMLDRISGNRVRVLGKGTWVKALASKTENGTIQMIIANYDSRSKNTETVPVLFDNITPGKYTLSKEFLDGRKTSEEIATSEAQLSTSVVMTPNTVSFLQLVPVELQAIPTPQPQPRQPSTQTPSNPEPIITPVNPSVTPPLESGTPQSVPAQEPPINALPTATPSTEIVP